MLLEINDLKLWFIIAVISFVVGITFIIILVKIMMSKFEKIAPIEKENNKKE